MRKKHVIETAASKTVWLCDEIHSHSGDESKTKNSKENWTENVQSVHLADDTLKQAKREREKIVRETTTTTGGESEARERFGIS